MDNNPYSIARNGGKHAGFYQANLHRTDRELQATIRKLQGNIAEHQEKIASPEIYAGEQWSLLATQAQEGIVAHWQKEVKNWQEQIMILEGILEERQP